jgi:DNA-directed RNA polymerase specialized sigma24 family protein
VRIEGIAAEGEPTSGTGEEHKVPRLRTISQRARDRAPVGMTEVKAGSTDNGMVSDIRAHSFPGREEFTARNAFRVRSREVEEQRANQNPHFSQNQGTVGHPQDPVGGLLPELSWEEERERRTYRGRTINMLRQYMRYSLDTGRLPSVLGREFFRAKVSVRSVVTFEDRVIFVHDMETSLNKLDEFSREIIARHILQEHDYEATARLLHCGRRTVQRYVPLALDLLSEILLDVGLLERTFPIR